MQKLFIFDVDGTIVNSKRQLQNSTIIALNKAIDKGHQIAIVTGRNFVQLDDIIKKIPRISYIASMNGGVINDLKTKKEYIYAEPINKELVYHFIEVAQNLKREFQCANNKVFYRVYFGSNPKTDISDPLFFKGGTIDPHYNQWAEVKPLIENMDIYHMAIKCESYLVETELNKIKNKFDHLNYAHIGHASYCYIECDPLNINKKNAIKSIQHLANINNKQTYFFGDSGNDISALEYVGNPVVMGNAKHNIKALAKYIIGSNDTDAIHDFVMNILNYED